MSPGTAREHRETAQGDPPNAVQQIARRHGRPFATTDRLLDSPKALRPLPIDRLLCIDFIALDNGAFDRARFDGVSGLAIARRHLLGLLGATVASRTLADEDPAPRTSWTVPIRLTDDRLWTSARLPSSRAEIALIDTGAAANAISERLAVEERLESRSRTRMEGLGGGENARWVTMPEMILGSEFTMRGPWFWTSPTLDETRYKVLIGAHSFGLWDNELDLARLEWRIHRSFDPAAAGYREVRRGMRNAYPHFHLELEVSVPDFTGRFQVDTGSPTNFILDGEATRRTGLWNSNRPYAPWRIRGFGPNRAHTRLYRVPWASVEGEIALRPLILASNPSQSQSRFQGLDGLIGLRALRNFNLATNGVASRFWIKLNDQPLPDDPRYPMSGLWLEQRDGAIVVDEVGIGSPAAGTDIRVGDQIVGQAWPDLLSLLNADPGTSVSLDIEREGRRSAASFTLRPYL